jgi:hypothetical protein
MTGGDWRSGGCGSVVLFLGGLELEEIHSSGGLRIGSEMLLDLLGSSNRTISCEFVFFFTSIKRRRYESHKIYCWEDVISRQKKTERKEILPNMPSKMVQMSTWLKHYNELVEYKHKFGSCNIATT